MKKGKKKQKQNKIDVCTLIVNYWNPVVKFTVKLII